MNASALFRAAGTGLGSALGRQAATAAVKDAVASRFATATTPAANKIDFTVKNWPHPRAGLLHFDLAELREKRPALARPVAWALWSFVAFSLVAVLNFVDTIVLTATLRGSEYSHLALFCSFMLILTLVPAGWAAVWLSYRGSVESRGRDKTVARVLQGVLVTCVFFFVFVPSGNLLGIIGLALQSRFQSAADA